MWADDHTHVYMHVQVDVLWPSLSLIALSKLSAFQVCLIHLASLPQESQLSLLSTEITGFYVGPLDLNSGLRACTTSTLLLPSLPLYYSVILYGCDKTLTITNLKSKGIILVVFPGYNPSPREVRAGTQRRNLEEQSMQEGCLHVNSLIYSVLIQPRITILWRVPLIVDWALLHQLAMKTVPHRHDAGQYNLEYSSKNFNLRFPLLGLNPRQMVEVPILYIKAYQATRFSHGPSVLTSHRAPPGWHTQPLPWTLQASVLTCSSLCNSTLLVVCFFVPLCLLALAHCSPLNPLLCPFLLPRSQVESSLGHSWVSQISLALLLPMLSHISIINSPPPYLETVCVLFFSFLLFNFFQDDSRLWQFDSKISLVYSAFPFLFYYSFCLPSFLSYQFPLFPPIPVLPPDSPPLLYLPPCPFLLFFFSERGRHGSMENNKTWHIKFRKTKHLPLY